MVRKITLMVAGILAMVVASAVPASAQYPEFVVSPGQAVLGGTVSFTGSGCAPEETVVITLTQVGRARAVGDSWEVATVTADGEGTYSGSFTVPADAEVGSYEVTASCGTGVEGADLEIVSPATTPPGGGGSLPRTGSDLNGYGLVGAGLLTAGGLILVATKRRRSASA